MSRAITVGSRCRGRRRIARRGAEREGNDGKNEEKAQGEAQIRECPVSLRAIDVHGASHVDGPARQRTRPAGVPVGRWLRLG